jgi:hypothetical protein
VRLQPGRLLHPFALEFQALEERAGGGNFIGLFVPGLNPQESLAEGKN